MGRHPPPPPRALAHNSFVWPLLHNTWGQAWTSLRPILDNKPVTMRPRGTQTRHNAPVTAERIGQRAPLPGHRAGMERRWSPVTWGVLNTPSSSQGSLRHHLDLEGSEACLSFHNLSFSFSRRCHYHGRAWCPRQWFLILPGPQVPHLPVPHSHAQTMRG